MRQQNDRSWAVFGRRRQGDGGVDAKATSSTLNSSARNPVGRTCRAAGCRKARWFARRASHRRDSCFTKLPVLCRPPAPLAGFPSAVSSPAIIPRSAGACASNCSSRSIRCRCSVSGVEVLLQLSQSYGHGSTPAPSSSCTTTSGGTVEPAAVARRSGAASPCRRLRPAPRRTTGATHSASNWPRSAWRGPGTASPWPPRSSGMRSVPRHAAAGPTSEMSWLPRKRQCSGRSGSAGTASLASTTSSWCCAGGAAGRRASRLQKRVTVGVGEQAGGSSSPGSCATASPRCPRAAEHGPSLRPSRPAQQLQAQAEDVLGIRQHELAGVGEHQAAAGALEQRLAEAVFELADLVDSADWRRAGPGPPPASGAPPWQSRPEVEGWWKFSCSTSLFSVPF